MLPPGAARLFTKPEPTGSKFCRKIIGIVCVSCMTAAVTGVEMTTITLGSNATSSLARAFIASTEPPAHRFSIRTLRPAVHPNACSPWTSAALFRSPSESPATSDRNMATRGRCAACCARAASEQRRRHGKAECLGSLEINDEFVFGLRLHRQIGRLRAPQDAVYIAGCRAVLADEIGPVGDEAAA